MTWTNISNGAVAVGGIPSSTTVTALRDNPGAMAAAENDAPVIFAGWHPVDKVTVGDSADGIIYDFSIDGVVANVETPDFEDGYEYRLVIDDLSHNSGGTAGLRIELYESVANVYSAAISLTSISNSSEVSVDAEIPMPRISRGWHFVQCVGINDVNNVFTSGVASPGAGDHKITRARVAFSAGSIDQGRIWLFRRREYASSP